MAEETNEVPVVIDVADQQEQEIQQVQPETPQSNPHEDLAREQGWVPKEEWTGDPEKWRPAKEFNERGELFGKIDHMGKELKETRRALKMLQEHNAKIKEAEYTRAVAELKALQKKHLEEGNSDGYLETSELLTDLKTEQKTREAIAETQQNQPHPDFTDWVARNKWYAVEDDMHDYADAVGLRYAKANPELSPGEVLTFVSKQVRTRFPEKFSNPNRQKPSVVEGSTHTDSPKKDVFKLTDEERRVMHTFVRTGAMTEKEFVDQVKMLRGN